MIVETFEGREEIEGIGSIEGKFKIMDKMMDWKFQLDSDEKYTLEFQDKREIDIWIPSIPLPRSEFDIIVRDANKFEIKK